MKPLHTDESFATSLWLHSGVDRFLILKKSGILPENKLLLRFSKWNSLFQLRQLLEKDVLPNYFLLEETDSLHYSIQSWLVWQPKLINSRTLEGRNIEVILSYQDLITTKNVQSTIRDLSIDMII